MINIIEKYKSRFLRGTFSLPNVFVRSYCEVSKYLSVTNSASNVEAMGDSLSDIKYKMNIVQVYLNISQSNCVVKQVTQAKVMESRVACLILNYVFSSSRGLHYPPCLISRPLILRPQLSHVKTRQRFSFREMPENVDLFSSPSSFSLAHCVGQDFRMGKGIAVNFKHKFGRVSQLLQMNKKIGEVAVLQDGSRFIFYLVTKEKSQGDPTFNDLVTAIVSLRDECVRLGVRHLAIPRLGCGLDKQNWRDVKREIVKVFSDTNVHIRVYFIPYRRPYRKNFQ